MKVLPISTRLACELQRRSIAGTPSEDWQTGEVRQTQVLIGPYKGCSVLEATYVPAARRRAFQGHVRLGEVDSQRNGSASAKLHVAAAHYQFEALHPFTDKDADGATGRHPPTHQYQLVSEPLINLSPYFEAQSDQLSPPAAREVEHGRSVQ